MHMRNHFVHPSILQEFRLPSPLSNPGVFLPRPSRSASITSLHSIMSSQNCSGSSMFHCAREAALAPASDCHETPGHKRFLRRRAFELFQPRQCPYTCPALLLASPVISCYTILPISDPIKGLGGLFLSLCFHILNMYITFLD